MEYLRRVSTEYIRWVSTEDLGIHYIITLLFPPTNHIRVVVVKTDRTWLIVTSVVGDYDLIINDVKYEIKLDNNMNKTNFMLYEFMSRGKPSAISIGVGVCSVPVTVLQLIFDSWAWQWCM